MTENLRHAPHIVDAGPGSGVYSESGVLIVASYDRFRWEADTIVEDGCWWARCSCGWRSTTRRSVENGWSKMNAHLSASVHLSWHIRRIPAPAPQEPYVDLAGIAPDFTGGMESAAYIKSRWGHDTRTTAQKLRDLFNEHFAKYSPDEQEAMVARALAVPQAPAQEVKFCAPCDALVTTSSPCPHYPSPDPSPEPTPPEWTLGAKCGACGKPAVCVGTNTSMDSLSEEPACDECCEHVAPYCKPLPTPPGEKA